MSKVVRMFDARNRARLATQFPTTPTGVMYEWQGAAFNVMPLTFGLLLSITEILDNGADILNRLKEAQMAIAKQDAAPISFADLAGEALQYVVRDAPQIIEKFRDHLAKSPGVVPAEHPEDREQFEAWFYDQDAIGMLREFLPKLREVIANRPLENSSVNQNPTPNSEKTTQTSST